VLGRMTEHTPEPAPTEVGRHFILDEIDADIAAKRFSRQICTRFPPEPNGYMHLGHAKAVTISYTIAQHYGGRFNLRFDDTNPAAETQEYVDAMEADVEWFIGGRPNGGVFHASDYFDKLYDYALLLVRKGLAYVDELTGEQIREYRGNFFKPGQPSPWRERPVAENLELLAAMRAGKFKPGERTLRAKIDPTSANMNMRDPLIYRVLDDVHHRAGDWHIYPLYDYAHPLSDAVEGVTHSLCGKEFANHRPLYDWFLEKCEVVEPPRQIEFAEIGITGTILAKRHLKTLVQKGLVSGWDDPRMPTVRGLRRRGAPAQAIFDFCVGLGVSSSAPGEVSIDRVENAIRDRLNKSTDRVMGVLRPLKVVIENYPEGQTEDFVVPNMPDDPSRGTRVRPFSKEIYIDESDFMESPPPKYFRLAPGQEVRLRYAYLIRCTSVLKDASGAITEIRATYDPASRGGNAPDGRTVKGTIHWVDVKTALRVEVRHYEPLFLPEVQEMDEARPIESYLNPASLEVLAHAVVEPSLEGLPVGTCVQFERTGYFAVDPASTNSHLVFNRTAGLRETKFAQIMKGQKKG
jgi:glutaminyl-tRNA synthetase